ncbi:MAG: hypothetical protein JWQ35_1907 [Bacteriovoracaceae bacterium]|nr:hypothetical protein [Bacteriovoracaceae bacterium]
MFRSLLIGLIFAFQIATYAEAPKRVGIIDIESTVLDPNDKESLLSLVRERIAATKLMTAVKADELESKLLQKNPLQKDSEKLMSDHENKKAEIEKQVADARNDYLSSRFDEAIAALQTAFSGLPEASLLLTPDMPSDILKMLAASYFFLGDEAKAKTYLSALLDLDSDALLDAEKYPPPLIEIFNSIKKEAREPLDTWTFESSQKEFKVSFLGFVQPVTEEAAKLTLHLPIKHSLFGAQNIVLSKEGFAPVIAPLSHLPKEVRFVSIEDRRRPTRGLFGPIVSGTPSAELKWFTNTFQLSIIFLGSAEKNADGIWFLKGQWLETPTSRTSAISESSHENISIAVDHLIDQMMLTLPTDKIQAEPIAETGSTSSMEIVEKKPFYKTWWFWTLAGVGVAGAGAGAYLFLKPESTLQFQMTKGN